MDKQEDGCGMLQLPVSPSVSRSERRENGGAAVPGMLGGGDDISISIIGSHEAERCSTETHQRGRWRDEP